MTKRDWLRKSSMTVMLSTTLLMFAEGGQAALAATNSQDSAKAEQVVKLAKSLLGKDYKYGANGPSQFDAPGLATYIYKQVGINVSDSVSAFYKAGKAVSKNDMEPGDLLFFTVSSSKTPSYLGIYIGGNQFIFANQSSDQVITKTLSSYYSSKLVGVRRLLDESANAIEPTKPADPVADTTPTAKPEPKPEPKPVPKPESAPATAIGDKIVAAGLKYLGTPYKFGDSRSDNRYMDCSDFTYNAYKDAGLKIPTNSRSQRTFIETQGTPVYDVKDLKKGDLIFMMSYKGYKKSDYAGIDKSKQRITHAGIYLGDGRILHTYSKEAGGVKISQFMGTSWEYRFVMGGRP